MRKWKAWMRRGGALLLAAVLAAAQPGLPALADQEEILVGSAEELALLADRCRTQTYSTGKTFRLTADLDLSEYENLFVPVMDGTFEGGGHTITGLTLTEEMSDYGLFRYVGQNGTVRNLTVEGEVTGGKEQENIGILAGSNAGTISGCTVRGTLNGQSGTGALAGRNEETGTVSRSVNEALVDGKQSTGGVVGVNEGTVTDCVNRGAVNTSQQVKKDSSGSGGISISIPNAVTGLTSDERANDTGGIAGYSTGSVLYCSNEATVGHERLGSATGGIVGRQSGSLAYSTNSGAVYGHKSVGGVVGIFEPYEATAYDKDYGQQLRDQMDALSSLTDELSDLGGEMGDHLSGNADALKEQLESLKNSIRIYMDDYGDMAEDGKDSIEKNVGDIRSTINGMNYDVNVTRLNESIQKIASDINEMTALLQRLQELLGQSGTGTDGILQSYNDLVTEMQEQLQELESVRDRLPAEYPGDDAAENEEAEETAGQETDAAGEERSSDGQSGADRTEETDGDESASSGPESGEAADGTADSETGSRTDEGAATGSGTGGRTDEGTDTGGATGGIGESADTGSVTDSRGGAMALMSYTTVSAAGSAETQEGDGQQSGDPAQGLTPDQQQELAQALQRLAELSADIRQEMANAAGILSQLPVQTSKLASDIKSIGNSLNTITGELGDVLDDVEDEMDTMTNDLRQKGDRVYDRLEATGDQLESDWDRISDCLDRMKDQFDGIRGTILDGFDELKDRIEDGTVYVDVSELADSTVGDGKVIGCDNSGELYADSQGGGIIGSIVKEDLAEAGRRILDLGIGSDDEEDEDEEEKDSFTRHVTAAVFSCVNTGGVTVKGDYAGGVVGRADFGMIVSSENYGDVLADGGRYAGGIAGRSDHIIRDCYVLSGVSADAYVGGVAGRGEDISDSYVCSYLDIDRYVESGGAVAGKAKGTVSGNYFVDNGFGAVDGVTRESQATAVDYASMLELKTMPLNFRQFTIRFMDGDEVVWQETFAYGDELSEADYPELPESDDGYVYWEQKDLSPVHRNVTVHAVYRTYRPALGSGAEDGKAAVLMGGSFYPDTELSVRETTQEELQSVEENLHLSGLFSHYYVKKAYHYELTQEEELLSGVTVRVLDDAFLADCIMTMDDGFETVGDVQKAEKIGGYLSADTVVGGSGYIVVLDRVDTWISVTGSAAAVAAAGLLLWLIRVQKLKKQKKENESVREDKE
ncbi:MAG: hypothetical protein Q4C82_09755 [Eubacteriales bacterium]|nr:hypothetical protein [Eubacteriales bacterium]